MQDVIRSLCVAKNKIKKDNKHLILIMLNLSVDNNDLFLVHDFFIVIGVLFVVCLFVCLFIFFAVVFFEIWSNWSINLTVLRMIGRLTMSEESADMTTYGMLVVC
jgi:quinol-cytochrome oxidoreductase complex cytochrome b subunit